MVAGETTTQYCHRMYLKTNDDRYLTMADKQFQIDMQKKLVCHYLFLAIETSKWYREKTIFIPRFLNRLCKCILKSRIYIDFMNHQLDKHRGIRLTLRRGVKGDRHTAI